MAYRELGFTDKKAARDCVLAARDGIDAQDKAVYDAAIGQAVIDMQEYRDAEVILAYASYRSEVDTLGLMRRALQDGKLLFAPKVAGRDMEFWRITAPEDLRAGYRGIPEPRADVSFPEWLAGREDRTRPCRVMMWMPGAAFDRERHRIGYGGGFYDRYLAGFSPRCRLFVAALAYDCQILEKIPHEAHDRKPDRIVTEKHIIA